MNPTLYRWHGRDQGTQHYTDGTLPPKLSSSNIPKLPIWHRDTYWNEKSKEARIKQVLVNLFKLILSLWSCLSFQRKKAFRDCYTPTWNKWLLNYEYSHKYEQYLQLENKSNSTLKYQKMKWFQFLGQVEEVPWGLGKAVSTTVGPKSTWSV